MSLQDKIDRIMYEIEDGQIERFSDPDYQEHISKVAEEAIDNNHPDGEYLLSVVYGLQGNETKRQQKRWESAIKRGNATAAIDYAYGQEGSISDAKTIALLKVCYDDCGFVASAVDDLFSYLDYPPSKEYSLQVEAHCKVIRAEMEKNNVKFKR